MRYKKHVRLVGAEEEEGRTDGRRLCVIRTASMDALRTHFMYDIVSVDRFDSSIHQPYIHSLIQQYGIS